MEMLVAGLLIWSVVHLSPSAAPALRQKLVGRMGENPYKGLFAVLILAGQFFVQWRFGKCEAPTKRMAKQFIKEF